MPTNKVQPSHPRRLALGAGVAAVAVIVVVAWGVASRAHNVQETQSWSNARAIPAVRLASQSAAGGGNLVLPGSLQAFNSAPIYPRVSGYVRKWYVDIGQSVRAGQLLAEIDTPELDQQIAQARADLANTEATRRLSEITAKRWADLLASEAVSKQEADEKAGDLAARTAGVRASAANLQRLVATKAFARITAPFDGVLTSRNVDIGSLVNAGAGSQASALFTVSNVSSIRAYVQAPQSYAAAITPGMKAELRLPEYPGRTFAATLARTSGAINDQSGSLLAEFSVANPSHELKPGGYAEVLMHIVGQPGGLTLPATALMFRSNGLQVAVVGPNGRVAVRKVTITRDMGAKVLLREGISATDRVIDNPPDSLEAGDLVRVVAGGAGA